MSDKGEATASFHDTNAQQADKLLNANKFDVVYLVLLVSEMRKTQKAYFKIKDRSLLIRSKELESLVDKELAELLK